ncbi:MAG: hypothetical protein PCFJNLEI_03786 [Verrucomicrobiae bacterium]|nr:hypothetical protein [Verrucomicrobiae bacterium]
MKSPVRAWPFESKYLRDFAVVEERRGQLRLFPATEQLPLLSKAIDAEFKAGLTERLAHTDARANGFRKHQLAEIALFFCTVANRARPDHLHIQPYYTPDLLTQIAVVQQITEVGVGGNRHWFRYFYRDAFLPDVFLCGKRPVISGHALTRYSERAVRWDCAPVVSLLTHLVYRPPLFLCLNENQTVFAFEAESSVVVMPFEETTTEFFFLTTLSPDGRSTLGPLTPVRPAHFHYGPTLLSPVGDFDLAEHTAEMLERWRNQAPPMSRDAVAPILRTASWTRLVQGAVRRGADLNAPALKFLFYDGVYGPTTIVRDHSVPAPKLTSVIPAPPRLELPSGPPPPAPLPDWLKPAPPA